MHISIILFWVFLFGVAAVGFLFGYFFNSVFRDIERREVERLEYDLNEKQGEIDSKKAYIDELEDRCLDKI